jgi:hypothetical protein
MATKIKVVDAKPKPGRTQKAVVAGPAGKQLNTDGSKHSSPNKHGKSDGGKGGLKL